MSRYSLLEPFLASCCITPEAATGRERACRIRQEPANSRLFACGAGFFSARAPSKPTASAAASRIIRKPNAWPLPKNQYRTSPVGKRLNKPGRFRIVCHVCDGPIPNTLNGFVDNIQRDQKPLSWFNRMTKAIFDCQVQLRGTEQTVENSL